MLACRAVEDRFGHGGDHITRQVGPDSGDKGGGNHAPGHDLVGRIGCLQKTGTVGFCRSGFTEKCLFLVLVILVRERVGGGHTQ
ncbi:hypothetical protein D9M68_923280 [compost metagenome]